MSRSPFRRLVSRLFAGPRKKSHLIRRAAVHAVEQLESRTLLTIVPGLNVSVGTDVTVTGSPEAEVITVAGGAAAFDQNLGSPTTPDWNNATVNAVNDADIVLNTSQTLYSLTLADTSKISISAGTGDPTNGNVLDITDPNTVAGGAGGLLIGSPKRPP